MEKPKVPAVFLPVKTANLSCPRQNMLKGTSKLGNCQLLVLDDSTLGFLHSGVAGLAEMAVSLGH